MNLKSLKLENFGCFKELILPLPNTGLIYIDGENRDENFSERNGVGKSTVLDSIPWALYGRTLREAGKKKLNQKEVIRQKSTTASVVLELEDEEGIFKVGRDVTRTKGSFWVESQGEMLKGDHAQEFFKKKFDLNFPAFLSSCLFGQGMSNLFLSSTDEEKMGMMEELFKLKDLEDIRAALKGIQEETGDQLLGRTKELAIRESEYKAQETRYSVLKQLHDTSRKGAQDTLSRINPGYTQSRIEETKTLMGKISNSQDEIRRQISEKKAKIEVIETTSVQKTYSVGDICPTCAQVIANIPREFSTYKDAVERRRREAEVLAEDVVTLKKELKSFEDNYEALNETYINLRTELKDQLNQIEKAKEVLALSNEVLEDTLALKKDMETKYQDLKKEVDTLDTEREQNSRLYKILGEKELRGIIVNKSLDLVNYYAKQYVSFLTNGIIDIEFYFKNGRIEAEINHRTQGKFPYLRYSGGERRRIDFGMFLAFNRVNRSIFNSPLSILLLDETFDALDNIGIEKCVELLKEETPNIGLILVTGHAENISELFDQKLTLVKKGGVTHLA